MYYYVLLLFFRNKSTQKVYRLKHIILITVNIDCQTKIPQVKGKNNYNPLFKNSKICET